MNLFILSVGSYGKLRKLVTFTFFIMLKVKKEGIMKAMRIQHITQYSTLE